MSTPNGYFVTSLQDRRGKLKTFSRFFRQPPRNNSVFANSLCRLMSKSESRRPCLKLLNVTLNGKNLIAMGKLDACNFFSLCNDCKLTQWMPASTHAIVSGSQHGAWVTYVFMGFYKHENRVGNLFFVFCLFLQENKTVDPHIFITLIFCQSWWETPEKK